jgi:hypothetical protein
MMNRYRVARSQAVSLSGTSAQSAAFGEGVYAVRLAVKGGTGAHVAFGNDPTATVNNTFIATGAEPNITFVVYPGEKIAAIQGGTGGSLVIDELS